MSTQSRNRKFNSPSNRRFFPALLLAASMIASSCGDSSSELNAESADPADVEAQISSETLRVVPAASPEDTVAPQSEDGKDVAAEPSEEDTVESTPSVSGESALTGAPPELIEDVPEIEEIPLGESEDEVVDLAANKDPLLSENELAELDPFDESESGEAADSQPADADTEGESQAEEGGESEDAPEEVDLSEVDVPQTLTDLGYWHENDDDPSNPLLHAIRAFQKVEGLPRTGVADVATLKTLVDAEKPQPRHPEIDGVEIDIARQVMFVVSGGQVDLIIDVSTGKKDWETPTGSFKVEWERPYHYSYERQPTNEDEEVETWSLYYPKYFAVGGYAVHGAANVPTEAASHGCVRVINPAMDMIWRDNVMPKDGKVTVH